MDAGSDATTPPPWRPIEAIRVVSIGLIRHDRCLLVVEVCDDAGRRKGWRPPGGGVHFLETAADALLRELREELGSAAHIDGSPVVVENLYDHHGSPGHEIVFAFDVTLAGAAIPTSGHFTIREHDASPHRAEWVEIGRFEDGSEILLPNGLAARL